MMNLQNVTRWAALAIVTVFGLSPPVTAQDSKPITFDPALTKTEDTVLASIRKWEERHWLKSWTGVVGLPLLDSESLAISPDGKSLAALGGEYLRIVDLATGRMTSEWDVGTSPSLTVWQGQPLQWSPDGSWIASPGVNKIVIRKVSNGEIVKELPIEGQLITVCFSKDTKRLVSLSAANLNTVMRQWTIADWKAGEDISVAKFNSPWTLASDGSTLVYPELESRGESHLRDLLVVDLVTGKRNALKSEYDWLAIHLAPDNRTLVGTVSGKQNDQHDVILVDTLSGKSRKFLTVGRTIAAPRVTPDGRILIVSEFHAPTTADFSRWFDLTTGKEVWSQFHSHVRLAFSPSGRFVVRRAEVWGGRVQVVDLTERLKGPWANDGVEIDKARKAGVRVDLHPQRIQFDPYYTDDFAQILENANKAYPKATSVTIRRGLVRSWGNYRALLEVLQKYKDLEELVIEGAAIKDDDLKPLAELKKLKSLDLVSATTLTGAGLAYLKSCSQLRRLHLTNCFGLKDGVWPVVASLKSLEYLEIRYQSNATATDIEKLAELKNLKTLKLGGNETINGKVLKHLKGLKHLEHLELESFPLSDEDIDDLVVLSSLRFLSIDYSGAPGFNLTEKGIAKLKDLPNLTALHITGGSFSVRALDGFDWNRIQSLHLKGFEVLNDDLQFLKNAKNLKFLGLPDPRDNRPYRFDGLKLLEGVEAVQVPYSLNKPDRLKELRKYLRPCSFIP